MNTFKQGCDYLENLGEKHLNEEMHLVEMLLPEIEEEIATVTAFIYKGATVHVKFTKEGKSLDDLLINYFKSLK